MTLRWKKPLALAGEEKSDGDGQAHQFTLGHLFALTLLVALVFSARGVFQDEAAEFLEDLWPHYETKPRDYPDAPYTMREPYFAWVWIVALFASPIAVPAIGVAVAIYSARVRQRSWFLCLLPFGVVAMIAVFLASLFIRKIDFFLEFGPYRLLVMFLASAFALVECASARLPRSAVLMGVLGLLACFCCYCSLSLFEHIVSNID